MSKKHKRGFARIFVGRPILGIVLNLLIVVAGLSAYSSIDIREMPNVTQNVLSIRTTYEGASPASVDKDVTEVLESALSALGGVQNMESQSSSGSSRITIDLSEGTDVDIASNEAREIVSNTLRQLPESVEDPSVSQSDSNADAIIRLALLGESASLDELTELAEGAVYNRLSVIDGIAEVTTRGSQADEFKVSVSVPALMSRNLSIFDVTAALTNLEASTPLGSVSGDKQTLALSVSSDDVTVQDIEDVKINATTSLSDVAFVEFVPEEAEVLTRVNGETAVSIDITRKSVGNTLTISQDVRAAVEELRSILPEGVELLVTSDDGVFIESSLNEVMTSIFLATLIVIAVIFVFLRSPRATFIPAITIPVALLGTLAAIWLAGFSINTISLLALVLATGMVVDDAIVVVENIVRKREEGHGCFAAAVLGTNEVFFAVISTTATLAAVFVPISFLPGQAGGIFSEFGFVLAFAVTLSSFTALTLTPVLASLLDPGKSVAGRLVGVSDSQEMSSKVPGSKPKIMSVVMNWSLKNMLAVLIIASSLGYYAFDQMQTLPSNVTPSEDRGFFLVSARGSSDTPLTYLNEQVEKIEAVLSPYQRSGHVSSVQTITGVGGGSSAFVIVRMPDWKERDFTQAELVSDLTPKLSSIPGVQIGVRSTNSLNIRGGGSGLTFALTGNNVDTLNDVAQDLVLELSQNPAFVNPQLSNESVSAQMEFQFDEDMMRSLNLSKEEVLQAIATYVEGATPLSVFLDDTEVDVNVVVGGPPIDDLADVESIYIQTENGFVPVGALGHFEVALKASQIERQNGNIAVSVGANLADGETMSTASAELIELAQEVLPAGVGVVLTGEAATLESDMQSMYIVFGIALLVVFLVLSAQFESFNSAVVILLTVPFGLAAAVLAISFSGGSLNYYSQIGLVMLIGVMSKNGILIVEFANTLRSQGYEIGQAIRKALELRMKPIMMTMVSTVFGGVPLVLSSGAGAEARMAVGWVIVGGLGFATVFTLFLTPIFYRLLTGLGGVPGEREKKMRKELSA